ncbi:MAG: hypothetical protein R2827_10790 [Bdellovibrionales bacterium]
MQTFAAFVEGKLKKSLDETNSKVDKSIAFLEGLELKIQTTLNSLKLSYSEIASEDLERITSYVNSVSSVRTRMIQVLKENAPEGENEDSLSEIVNEAVGLIDFEIEDETQSESSESSLQKFLKKAGVALGEKKLEIEKTINPEYLKGLKKESVELASLKIANSRISDICNYIDYLNDLEKYKTLIKSLDYAPISRKGNSIITNSLKDSFLKSLSVELSKLGGEKIPLFVDSSTREGKPTFQLSLRGANMPQRCKLESILSEGEQKIASLAGLLAELETAKHENGIILDDPVTSLDHQFRKKIAKRLVQEAGSRQVVVFTHDIAFLFDLEYFAKEFGVPTHLQNIRKDGSYPGVIFNSNPWHAQNVKNRLKTLRSDVEELKGLNAEKEDYNERAGIIYGRLRETWERAVEEVLLNEVITRFGQGIQTQRLNGVLVEDEDFEQLYFEMSKCSEYMIGHDKSLPLSDDRPPTKTILEDVEKVNEFVKRINKRKEETVKSRKGKVEKLPEAEVLE